MRNLSATQVTFSHTSGKSINELTGDLGIGCSMLARWKREQEEYKDNAFPGLGKVRRGTDLEEENRRLKKELSLVQEERDILKKAVAIFSKVPK